MPVRDCSPLPESTFEHEQTAPSNACASVPSNGTKYSAPSRKQLCGFLGEVRDDNVSSGAPDSYQRFQDSALEIQPAETGCGHERRIFTAHLIGCQRNRVAIPDHSN